VMIRPGSSTVKLVPTMRRFLSVIFGMVFLR
jgi:hypothetical protein